jgi:hypothetical protein
MSLKANQTDTIATSGGIDAAATSMTLTTGAFDTKTTGDKVPLIIDYDNAAKLEVVKAYINGTAVTSMERGQNGTAATSHSQGAKVCIGSVPASWDYWLHNDYGRAWTSWTPTLSVSGGTAPNYTAIFSNYYIQIGKIVIASMIWQNASGGTAGSGTNPIYFTLPVTANSHINTLGAGHVYEEGGTIVPIIAIIGTSYNNAVMINANTASGITGNDQSSTNRLVRMFLVYEAE